MNNAGTSRDDAAIGRRTFVKKGTGLLIVAGISGACTNPDGSQGPSEDSGTVHVILSGLHPSAATGGTATIAPAGGGSAFTVDIPASGDQSALVPAGDYTVQYTPPANHVLGTGQQNPLSVKITANQTTDVTVNLVAMGGLQVSITGLTGSPANGGSAVAQRTDATATPITINIAANGTGSGSIPSGTYNVTYTPPTGFTVSSTNPRNGLVVGLGATLNTGFTVAPVSAGVGTVHVTVNGLTGATAGGSASAKLTDNTGNTFAVTLSAPVGGSSAGDLTNMPPGSYNVTYTAPNGYRLVASQTNPQVANVASGGTSTVAYAAEQTPPPPVGIVYASDWHTTTGSTNAACGDGGKWDGVDNANSPSPNRLLVMAATGLGFPSGMVNVLRVTYENTSDFCDVNMANKWQLPAVGGSIFFRLYFRNSIGGAYPGLDNGHHHPVQPCNSAGGCCPTGWWKINKGPTYDILLSTETVVGSQHLFTATGMVRDAVYRFEEQWKRLGTNTWELHLRIYDSSNTLIKQDADFICRLGHSGGFHPLSTTTSITVGDSNCLRLRLIANQGADAGRGSTDPSAQWIYYGGFAVSLTDWCGAYVQGEAG